MIVSPGASDYSPFGVLYEFYDIIPVRGLSEVLFDEFQSLGEIHAILVNNPVNVMDLINPFFFKASPCKANGIQSKIA